jgi:hypothetical protein
MSTLTIWKVAVRTGPEILKSRVRQLWSLDLHAEGGPFSSATEAFTWADQRSRYLQGPLTDEVKWIHEDAGWAVLSDPSMLMASNTLALRELSRQHGRVICGLMQGMTGTVMFQVFDAGELRREIVSIGNECGTKGDPLPEEPTDMASFDWARLDALWSALGLGPFTSDPKGPIWGLQVRG